MHAIQWDDNRHVVDLIDHPAYGLLALLDQEGCHLNPLDSTF
jgi:myosin heavy subunit